MSAVGYGSTVALSTAVLPFPSNPSGARRTPSHRRHRICASRAATASIAGCTLQRRRLVSSPRGIHEMEEPPGTAASLTDEIIVEILSYLPVRSVCRFKRVCRSWRDLISHPDYRKKLPQTLAGFFYSSYNDERFPVTARHFTNVTGKGEPFIRPSLSFLPDSSSDLDVLDLCHGLLLFACPQPGPTDGDCHFVVCNPATENWAMLPDGRRDYARSPRVCFDPAVSRHFHVIAHVVDEDWDVTGLDIYSSKTGSWSFVENGWGDEVFVCDERRSVFFNGFLHLLAPSEIVAVDTEGKTWRTIPFPTYNYSDYIYQAQGCLYLIADDGNFKISIWTLDNYATNEWILKHTVSTPRLFCGKRLRSVIDYQVIAIHPEGNMIFFVFGWHNTLVLYIMDRGEVRVIRDLGHDCLAPYCPYVPLFLEAPIDGQ